MLTGERPSEAIARRALLGAILKDEIPRRLARADRAARPRWNHLVRVSLPRIPTPFPTMRDVWFIEVDCGLAPSPGRGRRQEAGSESAGPLARCSSPPPRQRADGCSGPRPALRSRWPGWNSAAASQTFAREQAPCCDFPRWNQVRLHREPADLSASARPARRTAADRHRGLPGRTGFSPRWKVDRVLLRTSRFGPDAYPEYP